MSLLSLDTTSLTRTSNLLIALCGKYKFLAEENITNNGGSVAPGGSIVNQQITEYLELAVVISTAGTTFQHPDLIGASVNGFVLNNTNYQKLFGDFTFNATTGTTVLLNGNTFSIGDVLTVPYSKSINIFGSTPLALNTIIPFSNVSSYDLPWTTDYIERYGYGADFSVEILGEDGIYRVTIVEITPDTIPNTASYHFDFVLASTGRIIF